MRIFRTPGEFTSASRPVCLAIGVFDGVHLGHQAVLRQTVSDARQAHGNAVAITFDVHPSSVVAPARTPAQICSLNQKLRMIEALGVDAVWLIHFDRQFSQQPAEDFARGLARSFAPLHSLDVGSEFTFGCGRRGNLALLQQLGEELHFSVRGLPPVEWEGQPISSTRIRQAIRAGDLELAGHMLGRPYSFAGAVIAGDGAGRSIGFPTANLDVTALALPPIGVYAARVHLEGRAFQAVLNIGHRPTLRQPAPQLRVEAHLLDFAEDSYGRELEVAPLVRLRDERQFPSLAGLRQQIQQDIARARQLFG